MESISRLTLPNLILYTAFILSLIISTGKILIEADLDKEDISIYRADFRAYYVAGDIIKNGNIENIYNLFVQNEIQQRVIENKYITILFLNTPVTALPFIPLAYLNFKTAYAVAAVVNAALIAVAILIICNKLKIDYRNTALLVLYIPIISAIHHNQITPLIFLVIAITISYLSASPSKSGLFAGLLFIKPQYLILLPLLFLIIKTKKEQIQFVKGAIISIAILFLSNFLLYGKSVYIDYFNFLKDRETTIQQLEKYEGFNLQTFSSVLDPIIGIDATFKLLLGVEILIFLAACYLLTKRYTDNQGLLISSAIILTLTLNLHTKYTDLVILAIPLLFLTSYVVKHGMNIKFVSICTIIMTWQLLKLVTTQQYIVGTVLLVLCGIWLLLPKKL